MGTNFTLRACIKMLSKFLQTDCEEDKEDDETDSSHSLIFGDKQRDYLKIPIPLAG